MCERIRRGIGLASLLVSVCIGLAGCRPAQEAEVSSPSDVELAVGIPDGENDPGTIPESETMSPPDVFVDADSEMKVTLSAVGPIPDSAADEEGQHQPGPDTSPTDSAQQPRLDSPADGAALENQADSIAELGGVAGPEDWRTWDQPQAVLVLTGNQHGYIEPCGCTGLSNQKGGMMRRYTLIDEIRDQGWDAIPLDTGNQIRRTGRQAAIKFQTTVKGLQQMGYKAIGFGADDLKLGASELLSIAADDGSGDNPFTTANVEILAPDLIPVFRKIEVGGRVIGITTALDPESVDKKSIDDAILIAPVTDKVKDAVVKMKEVGCDFNVVLYFGSNEAARELAKNVPGIDLIVAGDTLGEPRYQPEAIEGSDAKLIMTGNKGMYVGLVALYEDKPMKYARVGLSDEFQDARPMLDLMAGYQNQLKQLGLDGLEISANAHTTGREFVGTKVCGECHTTAFAIWEGTPHAEATEDIVNPGERSEIARHFDPECLSCHVTGWHPTNYYPYSSGYLSLEETPLMVGNGCENCHGPGKEHAEAEREGSGLTDAEVKTLREGMRLTLDNARTKCLDCHDLDNSPDFHKDGAFEEYWAEVEHYGLD